MICNLQLSFHDVNHEVEQFHLYIGLHSFRARENDSYYEDVFQKING